MKKPEANNSSLTFCSSWLWYVCPCWKISEADLGTCPGAGTGLGTIKDPVNGPKGRLHKNTPSSCGGNIPHILFRLLLFNSQHQMLMMIHSYLQKNTRAFKSSTMFSHPCDHGSSTSTGSVLGRAYCKQTLMCSNQRANSTHWGWSSNQQILSWKSRAAQSGPLFTLVCKEMEKGWNLLVLYPSALLF